MEREKGTEQVLAACGKHMTSVVVLGDGSRSASNCPQCYPVTEKAAVAPVKREVATPEAKEADDE
jgi:hypothetical protein